MVEQRKQRRLAAIFAADMVGYSRLMEADELGTIARQKTHHSELIDPKIAEHHGRIVKTTGDGMLVEFASVVDAVECAVAIQRAMAAREEDVPEDRRIQYRIGINLGDIVIDGDDIFGDGVNIASRLEGLADPGGVFISGATYEQLKTKVDVGYADLGTQQVKNIETPVRVYRVLLEPEASGQITGGWSRSPRRRQLGAIAVAAAVIVVAVTTVWWQPWVERVEPARAERMAFPLPDKPSIAVLPFQNMSSDSEQVYFADGIAEDIITDLSKLSGLFVIARNSSFQYRGDSVDVKTVGRELGVKYVLEGSVRRAGDRVRINAQLIDAQSGGHLWAERYDGSLNDVFALQDRINREIVKALALQLSVSEEQQLTTRDTDNPKAYDSFLKGWTLYAQRTPKSYAAAIPHFERAVALDKSYGRAYAALASIYWEGGVKRRWYETLGVFYGEARTHALKYLELAVINPTPLMHRVSSLIHVGKIGAPGFDQAFSEARKAVALDPNDPESHIAMAHILTMSGRPAEALAFVETAMRLNPRSASDYLFQKAFALFGMEKFAEAADLLETAVKHNPQDLFAAYLRAVIYALLDREPETRQALAHLEKISPIDYRNIPFFSLWGNFKTREDDTRMRKAQKKAGIFLL